MKPSRLCQLSLVPVLFAYLACSSDLDVVLVVPSPVAVGAFVYVTAKDACTAAAEDCTVQGKITLDQSRVDDPSIVAITSEVPTSVTLDARRVGTTTFRTRIDNGQRLKNASGEIRVAATDRVVLEGLACSTTKGSSLVAASTSFEVSCARFHGAEKLQGTGGVFPLESNVAKQNPRIGNFFETQASRGKGVVRSQLDSASIPIEVFELADVTAVTLELEQAAPDAGKSYYLLRSDVTVGGVKPCVERLKRSLVVTTPDVCENTGSTLPLAVIAKASGTCSLTVTLEGTSLSATTSFPVTAPGGPADAGPTDAGPTDAGMDARD